MAKLNQIIAIEKGVKSRVYGAITDIHKVNQKPGLFNGFSKEYRPLDAENGEKLPPERQLVQHRFGDVLRQMERLTSEIMDVTARKEWTNSVAIANVEVGDEILIKDVPVTYLLFLEKQLIDMRTFVGELPLLDEAEVWHLDANSGLMRTEEIQTHRTKKVQKGLTLIQPTEHHPGQAQLIVEDVLAGYWHQTKLSGAMPKPHRDQLMDRVEMLINAVKQAREAANAIDEISDTPLVGVAVFGYLFNKLGEFE